MSARRVIKSHPLNAEAPSDGLQHAATPTDAHYVRSNFTEPVLDHEQYRLLVQGEVQHACAFSLAELRAFPQHAVHITMECAGNDRLGMRPLPSGEPWGSGAVSTAAWSGVRLHDVLQAAGVNERAIEVLAEGADRGPRSDAGTNRDIPFARSLPLDTALHADTLLAMDMNGAPLPVLHGAPVRLIVPDWYGMASVKWVVRLAACASPFDGYFQRTRYVYDDASGVSPVTRTRVKSMITSPRDGDSIVGDAITVTGWAWSGYGPITRVELAVDGGDSWQDATLGAPASPHAWTPWRCTIGPLLAGRIVLRSRATDVTGARQPDTAIWNRLGYGNNAVRPVLLHVRSREDSSTAGSPATLAGTTAVQGAGH